MADNNPTPVLEMVERITRIIRDLRMADYDAKNSGQAFDFDIQNEAVAIQIIEAMREPTNKMAEVGDQAARSEGAHDCEVPMEDVYRAMIDTALGK